ncbi:hypothetical protein GE061_006325 [Apolygus lucorum]|uniref:Uncharacterized protein n=1 Tax=Apolygus lucorum TaxID=248454 RepID=A0A6A4JD99_APOLU|nr:hypothetical protein GE061_006325 [Apolygus lucorum]
MFKYVAIFVAVTYAQTHADIIEDGLAHIEKLSQMTAAQRQRLSEIASASKDLALMHQKTHTDALNNTLRFHAEMSKKRAEVLNCHPNVFQELAWISKESLKDWESCLNISVRIGRIIRLGIDFTSDLELAESIICKGIRNVTLCNETNIYDKFVCVSNAVGECTETFMSSTKGVLYWITQFDIVLEELGLMVAKCLNITNISFFDRLESHFDEHCQAISGFHDKKR